VIAADQEHQARVTSRVTPHLQEACYLFNYCVAIHKELI